MGERKLANNRRSLKENCLHRGSVCWISIALDLLVAGLRHDSLREEHKEKWTSHASDIPKALRSLERKQLSRASDQDSHFVSSIHR